MLPLISAILEEQRKKKGEGKEVMSWDLQGLGACQVPVLSSA